MTRIAKPRSNRYATQFQKFKREDTKREIHKRAFVGQWCNPSYVEIAINLLNLSYLPFALPRSSRLDRPMKYTRRCERGRENLAGFQNFSTSIILSYLYLAHVMIYNFKISLNCVCLSGLGLLFQRNLFKIYILKKKLKSYLLYFK